MDVGATLSTALNDLIAFVPSLIAGLIILALGYVIAKVLAKVVRPLLHRVGFDRLVQRLGIADEKEPEAGSHWAGSIVFALVILIALLQAARTWQLDIVAAGLAQVVAYLPHVFGAAIIFAAALFFGNWVRERILHGADGGAAGPGGARAGDQRLVASSVRAGILALGAFMALRELQVAAQIVTIGFALVLGAIALAAALAFGLGSREVAGRVTQRWYERGASRGNDGGSGRARSTTMQERHPPES